MLEYENKNDITPGRELCSFINLITKGKLMALDQHTLKCLYAKSSPQAPTTPLGMFSLLTKETKKMKTISIRYMILKLKVRLYTKAQIICIKSHT